jgi:hypothetical protein
MALPTELQDVIEQALATIQVDQGFELRPYYRQKIYLALGSRVRGCLAMLVVRHILPIWKQQHPEDPRPDDLLKIINDVLHGVLTTGDGQLIAIEKWNKHVEQIENDPRDFDEVDDVLSVLDAAIEALFESSSLYRIDSAHVTQQDTDNDLDDTCSDTAHWAEIAVTRNFKSDVNKRRLFWEWWLQEAIPSAWEAASNPSD